MNHVAPTYKIQVDDGSPSDAVDGVGMGSLEQPGMKIHTSYGFIWRWTMYYLFNSTRLSSCLPQAAGMWFEGKVYLHGQPANGYRVVFSSQADGPWASQPAITGPTPIKPYDDPGHYSHIISAPGDGPVAGDWYVWIVNANGVRISAIGTWHSDKPVPEGTGCNEAVVNFDS